MKEKASKTALKVGMNILALGSKPGMDTILPEGIVDSTEKILLASGAASARTIRMTRSKKMVRVYEWFDWMLPGQFEAFAHRKVFCENQVRDAILSGFSQVLVLGAGYDTLGWRLAPEFPEVHFFEIDNPATSAFKARGIDAMGHPDNLILLSEDLGQKRLVDVMTDHTMWNSEKDTIIIAEGLLMYLPEKAVEQLLYQCALISEKRKRLAFTYVPSGEDGKPDAGKWTFLVLWLLKNGGEPWLWSICPEDLTDFLEKYGWSMIPDYPEYGVKHGLEYLCIASSHTQKS